MTAKAVPEGNMAHWRDVEIRAYFDTVVDTISNVLATTDLLVDGKRHHVGRVSYDEVERRAQAIFRREDLALLCHDNPLQTAVAVLGLPTEVEFLPDVEEKFRKLALEKGWAQA